MAKLNLKNLTKTNNIFSICCKAKCFLKVKTMTFICSKCGKGCKLTYEKK